MPSIAFTLKLWRNASDQSVLFWFSETILTSYIHWFRIVFSPLHTRITMTSDSNTGALQRRGVLSKIQLLRCQCFLVFIRRETIQRFQQSKLAIVGLYILNYPFFSKNSFWLGVTLRALVTTYRYSSAFY